MVMMAGMGIRAVRSGRARAAGRGLKSLAGKGIRALRGGGGVKAGASRGRGFHSVGKRGVVGYIDKKGKERTMRTGRSAVIGKNLPKHRMIVRLRHNLKRHMADIRTLAAAQGMRVVSAGAGRRGARPPPRFNKKRRRT